MSEAVGLIVAAIIAGFVAFFTSLSAKSKQSPTSDSTG